MGLARKIDYSSANKIILCCVLCIQIVTLCVIYTFYTTFLMLESTDVSIWRNARSMLNLHQTVFPPYWKRGKYSFVSSLKHTNSNLRDSTRAFVQTEIMFGPRWLVEDQNRMPQWPTSEAERVIGCRSGNDSLWVVDSETWAQLSCAEWAARGCAWLPKHSCLTALHWTFQWKGFLRDA